MSGPSIVTVGDTAGRVIERLQAQPSAVRVVQRCSALVELLAACQGGAAGVAVVAAGAAELTATLVDRLAAVGVSVLALAESDAERARLLAIGAHPVPAEPTPDELLAAIAAAERAARYSRSSGFGVPGAAPADVVEPPPVAASRAPRPPAPRNRWLPGRGQAPEGPLRPAAGPVGVVAVWGPAGAPGRTTVALNVAAELAAQGQRVMLIDADTYGASVAASLGLLEEAASLARACRVADQGLLTAAELARIGAEVVFTGGSLRLLSGLTRADRWPELRSAAVAQVLSLARDAAEVVVVDCGFCLERDEELSYDTVAPRRNAAALTVLGQADVVLAVGTADTIGMPRLIRGLAEVAPLAPTAQIVVVLNKVRKRAAGTSPRRALEQAWERFGPALPLQHFLPWDGELLDRALLEGKLLLEISPEAALRQAIRRLCCAPVQRIAKLL